MDKTEDNVKQVLNETANEHQMSVPEEDINALADAYMKRGDVDLAINSDGEVLSDIMDEEQLDTLSANLYSEFGEQNHDVPFQIRVVKIDGRSYDTYVDDKGVQRFVGNPIIRLLVRNMQKNWKKYYLAQQETDEGYDSENPDIPLHLGAIAEMYKKGEFSLEQYLDFYAAFSFSLKWLRTTEPFDSLTYENLLDSSN
jgi:hypothetical protein